MDLREAQRFADGLRRPLVVARQHDQIDVVATQRVQCRDGVPARLVRNGQKAHKPRIISQIQRRLAGFGLRFSLRNQRRLIAEAFHDASVADCQPTAFHQRRHADARLCFKLLRLKLFRLQFLCMGQNRLRQRMFGGTLQRRRQRPEFRFVNAVRQYAIDDGGPPFRHGSRLVQNNRIHMMEILQLFRVFEQDAKLRAAACADHDRHWRRQAQRAWAADDQHGNAERQRDAERRSGQQPADSR